MNFYFHIGRVSRQTGGCCLVNDRTCAVDDLVYGESYCKRSLRGEDIPRNSYLIVEIKLLLLLLLLLILLYALEIEILLKIVSVVVVTIEFEILITLSFVF